MMNQTTSIKETSANPAESTYTAIVLAPETNLPWARELLNALQPTHTASNIAQLIQLLKKKKVDAVIALEPTEALLAFFQSIEQHRMIRVLVTDHFDRSDLHESADVVCPPLPRYIHQQIGQAVQAKAERSRLYQEIELLKADNQALQAKLDVEQETIHELEVLKSAIVRNVSHELRTPLLQVKSAVALMD
ncbi:MAG: cell wall metabolism sensor histidine kinase WalK, partial [Anaerolineae bacterium]|nr:cell wall metabolism sensor histidine kinase WalK [Anaerolineae bacterium]